MKMTRAEHLAWCKKRALEYIDRGDITNGITSMISDMDKHPQTQSSTLNELTTMMLISGHFDTVEKARKHIEGYN